MSWLRRHRGFVVAVLVLGAVAVALKAGLRHGPAIGFDLGGPFTLTAAGGGFDGRTVTEASWPGKLLLITFGYCFCPDVCPTRLQAAARAVELLGPQAAAVQPLFITVDPERDTRQALEGYVAQFSPRLIGLTGTPEQIAAVARAFRVWYRKVPGATPESYSVDHSAFTYLANDRGAVIKLFGHDAEQLRSMRRAPEGSYT